MQGTDEEKAEAVNKLDQVGYSQAVFETIVNSYSDMADRIGISDFTEIPVSALHGDNVVSLSDQTPWYRGPTLLEWLEQVPSALDDNQLAHASLRFAIQLVMRGFDPLDGGGARGYGGRLSSGVLTAGQRVRILPSGHEAVDCGAVAHEGLERQVTVPAHGEDHGHHQHYGCDRREPVQPRPRARLIAPGALPHRSVLEVHHPAVLNAAATDRIYEKRRAGAPPERAPRDSVTGREKRPSERGSAPACSH